MDRLERKQIKHDAFIEGTMSFVERFEHNPKPYIMGAVAVLAAFFGTLGIWKIVEARGEHRSEALARAQAALFAPIVTGEQPKPDSPYRPTFATQEARRQAATERLAAVPSSGTAGRVGELLRATTLLDANQAGDAIAILEPLSKSLSSDNTLAGPVKALLASAYHQAGRNDDALTLLSELAEGGSKDYPRDMALASTARILESMGRVEDARSKWQSAIDEDPQSPIAQEGRRALERLGGGF